MRIAVLVLVLANFAFFGWSHWQGDQAEEVSAPVTAEPIQLATAGAAPATHCQSLGPFNDSTQMLTVSAMLTAHGIGSMVRQVERKVSDGNWVYIDGFRNSAERQQAMQQLRRSGLRDVAELNDPRYSGRISAGIFVDPRGAAERAARVRAAGFDPVVEERQRAIPERWLNVEWNVGVTPIAPTELGITGTAGPPVSWTDCPAVSGTG